MTKLGWRLLIGMLSVFGFAVQAQDSAPSAQFSEAETTVWLGDQLAAITAPTVLTYDFVKSGTFEAGFTDRVIYRVTGLHPDGTKSGVIDFFSGERHFDLPPEEKTNINPVLKVYFQGDVYEMNRLTDPDRKARERWRYFQRRIKFALAEGAKVEPVKFEFSGLQYAGKRVSFMPYAKDPKRSEFEQFADKAYAVTVSDQLPGYVYKIESVVPGKDPATPLIQEVLQLSAISAHKP
jgi:hypothetical protein